MLLFPLWLLGVATYWFCKRDDDIPGGKLIFVCAFIWFVALLFGRMNPLAGLVTSFRSSLDGNYLSITPSIHIFIGSDAGFLSDYVLGIAFAITVATSKYLLSPLLKLPGLVKDIRFSSSYTFSLYLFHAPLLYFFVAISQRLELTEPLRGLLLTLAVFLSAYVLGGFTEHRKAAVHRIFSSFFDRISAKFRFLAS